MSEKELKEWRANAKDCRKTGCKGFWKFHVCQETIAQKQCRLEKK